MLLCWSVVHSIASITAVTYLWGREGASCAGMLVSCARHCQHNSSNLPVVEGRSQLCWSAVHSIASITSVTYLWWREEPAVMVCWSAVHSIASITAVTYLWWREGASCAGMLVCCALHCQHNICNLPVVEGASCVDMLVTGEQCPPLLAASVCR